tara:strand:+ start:238 stop:438 length:201 start_codon:yes stop_codon:yes gene_type:complete
MKIKRYKDGSADLIFEEHEKKIIKDKGKFHFDKKGLNDFGLKLVEIVAEFHKTQMPSIGDEKNNGI